MQNLERRIAELEKTGSINEGPMTIIIRCMTPGNLDAEIYELHDSKGCQRWTSQLGETEQGLIDRASFETKRNPYGVACLTSDVAKVSHDELLEACGFTLRKR